MGERTQLFINVENKRGQQILGTVVHYQWGYGRVMLANGLNIAAGVLNQRYFDDNRYSMTEAEKLKAKNLDSFLKDKCNLLDPILALELRKSIIKYIDGNGDIICDTSRIEKAIADNERIDLREKRRYIDNFFDPAKMLKKAYAAKYNNFFKGLDNNDGFMIINIKTNSDKTDILDIISISFGFGITTISSSDNWEHMCMYWTPANLDEYAGQSVNQEFADENYVAGYKCLLEAYGIKLMSKKELIKRCELVKNKGIIDHF